MIKRIGLVLVWGLGFGEVWAQVTFQKTYGGTGIEIGYFARQTTDGGYIIAGLTTSFGAGNVDIYLIKTDGNGDTLWTRTFGGAGTEHGYSVQQTTDGGYIISGRGASFGAGGIDVYLLKTDANGSLLWTKTFGGIDEEWYPIVQQTADGGYIIEGTTTNFSESKVFLIKTNSFGDSLWTKIYDGIGPVHGNFVQQTMDEGYIIVGSYDSSGAGNDDVHLIKTDTSGNLTWTKTFGAMGSDRGRSVEQTIDGGYIITGFTNNFGAGNDDVYLIKTDTNGDLLWSKTFGGTSTDEGWTARQTTDGGYIIVGHTAITGVDSSNVYLIKTDANGDSLWTKTFGGNYWDEGISVQQTMDKGYIISGFTESFGASIDVYLIKTDSLGNSGCNELATTTIVSSPPTQVTSPAITVSSTNSIVTIPAASVGSGSIVITLCATVGIHYLQSSSFNLQLFPNPTTGTIELTFNTKHNGAVQCEIMNVMGERVYEPPLPIPNSLLQTTLDVSFLAKGIYVVRVGDGERWENKKLVVE